MRNLLHKETALRVGQKIKALVSASKFTKEEITAHVQVKFREVYKIEKSVFSLSGLDKIFKGDLPKAYCNEILEAVAEKLECSSSEFYEDSEKQSA